MISIHLVFLFFLFCRYNYNREDEEIYKEFLEIANELIPNIVKITSDLTHSNNNICDADQLCMSPGTRQGQHCMMSSGESGTHSRQSWGTHSRQSWGTHQGQSCDSPGSERRLTEPSLLEDPESYSMLLIMYDGICQWEEGSSTPVLHITWAKHLVHSMSKFGSKARTCIAVHVEGSEDDEEEVDKDGVISLDEPADGNHVRRHSRKESLTDTSHMRRHSRKESLHDISHTRRHSRNDSHTDVSNARRKSRTDTPTDVSHARRHSDIINNNNKPVTTPEKRRPGRPPKRKPETVTSPPAELTTKTNGAITETLTAKKTSERRAAQQMKTTIAALESQVGEESQGGRTNPDIAALASACGESILNPEYLLGGGEPFTSEPVTKSTAVSITGMNGSDDGSCMGMNGDGGSITGMNGDGGSSISVNGSGGVNGSGDGYKDQDPTLIPRKKITTDNNQSIKARTPDTKVDIVEFLSTKSNGTKFTNALSEGQNTTQVMQNTKTFMGEFGNLIDERGSCEIVLRSAKMRGLKSLVTSSKLNASAIKLQLTAQSQVSLKHSKITSEYDFGVPRKRSRRDFP